MAITAAGLGSGLDVKSLVEQLVSSERTPAATRLASQETKTTTELTAIGRLKSALATFQDAVGKLADPEAFQQRKASTSDAERLAVSATSSAIPASYEVEVHSLATAHRLVSPAFAGEDAIIGEGQLRISSGEGTLQIELTSANSTLAGIRDAINTAAGNPGVRASIVTSDDGAHLILTATSTGTSHAITVDALAAGSPLEALEFGAGTTQAMTEATAASDASATIDGLLVTSANNRIEGAIQGVTIDLLQAEPGTVVKLEVAHDKAAASQALIQFVNAYNAVVDTINGLTAYNSETKAAGPLLGDAATRAIRNALRETLGRSAGSEQDTFRTLSEIGISSDLKGRLSLDTSRFDKAVDSDFDAVGRVLGQADSGIAVRMKAAVDEFLGSGGRIQTREKTLKDQLDNIGLRREALDVRMEQVRARYQKQFMALDTLMSQLTQTSNYLAAQLGNS
ncbi:MAG: flagellar filament capping protein FliD [Gammaproteobacteria bacterium]|nr:flagellar filament capping protein FliD [Gammaproteobacteria bacterium]